MAFDLEELKKAVIAQDDFAHELRVGAVHEKTIRHMDLDPRIEYGGTYTDDITKKPRQFDYRFEFTCVAPRGKCRMGVYLAVECKNISEESPVVISGLQRTFNESYYVFIESRFETHYPSVNFRTVQAQGKPFHYPAGEFVGKSILRPKLKNKNFEFLPDSDVYEKWSQAIASSIDLIERANALAYSSQTPNAMSIVLPIVVVPNDRLMTLEYHPDGSLKGDIKNVKQCEYFVGREITIGSGTNLRPFNFSHIHFMTLGGFDDFLNKIYNHPIFWENLMFESGQDYTGKK